MYSDGYHIGLLGLEHLHPFDVNKYARIAERLTADGWIEPGQLIDPGEADEAALLEVHAPWYLDQLKDRDYVSRAIEVPLPWPIPMALLDRGLLAPMRRATAGTMRAVQEALTHGIAINLGGGYHHAQPGLGHGFCIYADVGIALRRALKAGQVERVLIVDLDAHHGDGNAMVFQDEPAVHILDLYEANNFPYAKLPVWRKVEFGPGVGDAEYLEVLERELPPALEDLRPDLVVYVAGVDVYDQDPLTRFALTRSGILARDRFVFEQVRRLDIPLAMVLAGGYAQGVWEIQHATIQWVLERFRS